MLPGDVSGAGSTHLRSSRRRGGKSSHAQPNPVGEGILRGASAVENLVHALAPKPEPKRSTPHRHHHKPSRQIQALVALGKDKMEREEARKAKLGVPTPPVEKPPEQHHSTGLFGTLLAAVPFGAVKTVANDTAKYVSTGGGAIGHALDTGASDVAGFLAEHGVLGTTDPNLRHFAPRVAQDTAKRALKDFADLPVEATPALYNLADTGTSTIDAAVREATGKHGDFSKIKKLGKGLSDDTSLGQLIIHGDPKKALELAEKHPGNAILELMGGEGAAGRALGIAGRLGGAKFASTAREAEHVAGNVSRTRHYSPNAIHKAFQVANEKLAERRGKNPNELGDKLGGKTRVTRELKRRVWETGSANEIRRRMSRQKAKDIMAKAEAGVKGVKTKNGRRISPRQIVGVAGKHTQIMGLLAQRIVRRGHVVGDLKKYRQWIKDVAENLGDEMPKYERSANEKLVEAITNALADKKFVEHPDAWFDAAETYIKHRNEADDELERAGLLTPEQRSARNLPALQIHRGVRFDPTREATLKQELHRAAVERAGALEKEVRDLERKLTTAERRAYGQGRHNKALDRRGRALPGNEEVVRLRNELQDIERQLGTLQRKARSNSRKAGKLEGRASERVARSEASIKKVIAEAEATVSRVRKEVGEVNGPRARRSLDKLDRTIARHEDAAMKAADAGDESGFAKFSELMRLAEKRRKGYAKDSRNADRVAKVEGRAGGARKRSADQENGPLLERLENGRGRETHDDVELRQLRQARRGKQAELRDAERRAPRVTERERQRQAEEQGNVDLLRQTLESFRAQHGEARKAARAIAPRKGERSYISKWKDENGNPLNRAEGEKMLEDAEAANPGFLSHSPAKRGARQYHQTWDKRPERDHHTRTGQAVDRGTGDNSWQGMTDDLVGAVGKADAAKAWDRAAGEFGFGPKGKVIRGHNARKIGEQYIRELEHQTGMQFVLVRVAPLQERLSEVNKIIDRIGEVGELPDVDNGALLEKLIDAAESDGPGPYVVVPKSVMQEWREVATGAKSNTAMKVMQVISQNFRRTVLPLSPKWFFGNVAEASMRSLFYGHGPLDWYRGVKVLKRMYELDPEKADQLVARTLGGRLYGSTGRTQLHRGPEQFKEGTAARGVARAAGTVSRLPGIRRGLAAVKLMQDGIFGFNEWLEDQFAIAGIGAKAKKEIQETNGYIANALHVQQEAMDEFIKHGLTDTNKQVEFGRYLDEVLGRYSKHSPEERWVIQTFMPFWDWYRNALQFVLVTLPKHHPIKTGLIAATEEAMEQENHDAHNVSAFTDPGDFPNFLRGSIPTKDGKRIQLQRYLPFGAFSDPVGSLGDLVLPQFSTQQAISKGLNWKGNSFTKADGSPASAGDLVKAMAYGTLSGQVPGVSLGQRFAEGGGSAYDDSTLLHPKVRDGSKLPTAEAAKKILLPWYPVTPGGKKSGGGSTTLKSALGSGGGISDLNKATKGPSDLSDLISAIGG